MYCTSDPSLLLRRWGRVLTDWFTTITPPCDARAHTACSPPPSQNPLFLCLSFCLMVFCNSRLTIHSAVVVLLFSPFQHPYPNVVFRFYFYFYLCFSTSVSHFCFFSPFFSNPFFPTVWFSNFFFSFFVLKKCTWYVFLFNVCFNSTLFFNFATFFSFVNLGFQLLFPPRRRPLLTPA